MAMDWQSDEYKQAVAAKGGHFDSQGAETTQNTWGTEAVNPQDWEDGAWYTNPNSGRVERWWADGGSSSGSGSSGSGMSGGFDRMDRNANPGDAYFWDAADGWKPKDGGSSGLSLSSRPTIDIAGQYKTLYDELGIKNYRDQMTEYTNQVNALQEELTGKLNTLREETNQAAALINENPWSSSANRSGRLAKLEQQYQNKAALMQNEYSGKLNAIQNNMTNTQNQYQMAMTDLNTQMSNYTQQYQYDLNNYDANLAQLNTLLDMGALDNASMGDLQTLASQTGMSADMINSMIQATKNSKYQPQLVMNTDDYGNVTATLIDTKTGKVINQNNLGKIDASRVTPSSLSGGRSGGSGSSNVNSLLTLRKNMKDQGLDTSVIDSQLEMYGVSSTGTDSNINPATGKPFTNLDTAEQIIDFYRNGNVTWAINNQRISGNSNDERKAWNYVWPDQMLEVWQQSGASASQIKELAQKYMKPADRETFLADYGLD